MEERKLNFLEEIIEKDLADGKVKSIMTRFPPEPNGYLHLGHAKSICLNFGLAQKYGGKTNLRYMWIPSRKTSNGSASSGTRNCMLPIISTNFTSGPKTLSNGGSPMWMTRPRRRSV